MNFEKELLSIGKERRIKQEFKINLSDYTEGLTSPDIVPHFRTLIENVSSILKMMLFSFSLRRSCDVEKVRSKYQRHPKLG